MNYLFLVLFLTSFSVFAQETDLEMSEENETIPFAIIDEKPNFKECLSLHETKPARDRCFQERISKIFSKNFDTNVAAKTGFSGKLRLFINFEIMANGSVDNIVVHRSPNEAITNEAIRVTKLIPTLIPGKRKGEAVAVKYTLPLIMMIQ